MFVRAALTGLLAVGLILGSGGTASANSPVLRDSHWPANTRGDGCSSPTWPTHVSAGDRRRVLVIGDSLVRDSRHMLESSLSQAGWVPTVRCWGAKGSTWGVGQVQRARQLRQLPKTVIVSLGTNDIWWLGVSMETAVDRMMRELGSSRTVYWVNLWFGPHGYSRLPQPHAANRVLNAKARQYPNLKVINFARGFREARSSNPSIGWTDGVHLNTAGYQMRTRLIVSSLDSSVWARPKRS
jgi:hypothetical protein